MTLQEHCKKDKLTIIAMHALLCECAEEGSIVLDDSLSGICREAGVHFTALKGRALCPSCNTRRMVGEQRPNVQWTFAARRTTGQEVRAGACLIQRSRAKDGLHRLE